MQEEVEQRIVSLMISCGKLGEQEFRKAVAKLLEQLKNGHQKHQYHRPRCRRRGAADVSLGFRGRWPEYHCRAAE